MARVTLSAAPNRTIHIWHPDVAPDTSSLDRGCPFELSKLVRRSVHRAGMVTLPKGDLVDGELRRPAHSGPGRQPVPTADELLVLGPVTRLIVQGRDIACQLEVVMRERILTVEPLVTVVAGDVGLVVLAAFELVDDRTSLFPVALRAPPGGLCEGREWFACLTGWSRTVDQQSRQDQAAPNDNGNEDRPERHGYQALKPPRPLNESSPFLVGTLRGS